MASNEETTQTKRQTKKYATKSEANKHQKKAKTKLMNTTVRTVHISLCTITQRSTEHF